MLVKFIKLSENAVSPTLTNVSNSDWDIYSAGDYEIDPCSWVYVASDLTFIIPDGYCAKFMSDNVFFDCTGFLQKGINEYVNVLVHNKSVYPQKICKGEKIARVVFENEIFTEMQEIANDDCLELNGVTETRALKRKLTRDVFTDDENSDDDFEGKRGANLTYFI